MIVMRTYLEVIAQPVGKIKRLVTIMKRASPRIDLVPTGLIALRIHCAVADNVDLFALCFGLDLSDIVLRSAQLMALEDGD